MLKRILVVVVTLGLLVSSPLLAQESKPQPAPAPAEKMPAPRLPPVLGQPVNIKVDLTITDHTSPGQPAKRTLSMIVADQMKGSIRNRGFVALDGKGRFDVILNVDATPVLMPDRTIRLVLALEYAPKPDADNAMTGEGRSHLNQNLTLILVPGKTLTISQASDPTSDRRITVDVIATILT
jgi:hypothetical protein